MRDEDPGLETAFGRGFVKTVGRGPELDEVSISAPGVAAGFRRRPSPAANSMINVEDFQNIPRGLTDRIYGSIPPP